MSPEPRNGTGTGASKPAPLTAPQRRRLLLMAVLRSLVSVVVLLSVYFLLPLSNISETRSIIGFVIGLLVMVVVLALQTRLIVNSAYPLVRAVEALSTTVPLFLLIFATAHFLIESQQPGSYSSPMTRLDALYFTITTFATVGYGDIAPIAELARLAALLQMVLGLILVGVIARVITGAAELGLRRRQGDHDES